MTTLSHVYMPLILVFTITGCSTVQTNIGPDKQSSELRASIEAPVELSSSDASFCVVVEPASAEPDIVRAPTPTAVPEREPYNATLYFLLDKTEFTPTSAQESVAIYQHILDNPYDEVVIVGHTDTAASNSYNDALSQRRAERVRQDLINLGLSDDVISISSEGEYRLLIATPDDTVEQRNRRVEINAR